MPIDPGPYDIDAVRPVLAPSGEAVPLEVGPDFYPRLMETFPDFRGHVLIQRFSFAEPWPTWELHPEGDEFVFLLSGDVDFLMQGEDGKVTTVRVDQPGQFVLVPQGAWHTARPHAPTSMLFVTPGEGTQNEVEPPARDAGSAE